MTPPYVAMDISPRNCLSLQLRLSDLALVNRGSGHRAGDRRTNIRPVDISSKADQYIRGTSKMYHTHFTLTLNIFKQIRHSVTFFSETPNYKHIMTFCCAIYTIILLKSVCLSVGVRKRQVAIIALSSREMYLTVRIV